jgi:hypothetical protein
VFAFINRRRQQAQAQRETAAETYARLIGVAVEAGDLSAADEAALWDAADTIGRNVEQVEAEIVAKREDAADAATVAAGESARAELERHREALRAFDADTARQREQLDAKRAGERRKLDANAPDPAPVKAGTAAAERMRARREHDWRTLGIPDPAVARAAAARVRHLVRDVEGADIHAGTRDLPVEVMLRDPDAYGDLAAFLIVPAPGQDADEFAYLRDVVETTKATNRAQRQRVAMLVRRADIGPGKLPSLNASSRGLVVAVEDIDTALAQNGKVEDPDRFTLVRYPGTTQAQLDAHLATWRAAYAVWLKRHGRTAVAV